MKCPTCNKEIEKSSVDESSMKKNKECFECALWRKRLHIINNPDVAIIDGTFYTIDDEDDPSSFRGFGGAKFVINFKDGRVVTTTNLWCGGKIPNVWKPKFPNNANFDWQWKEIGNYSYFVPKEIEEIPDESS